MAQNVGKLAGRTLFITGASRGIGKAIALKAARDGANIVIAAKTAQPHPKLPGTIYTAAKEVEALGGRCLPCIVDIQHEDQVEKAVAEAVQMFGGIDILVNNASAINLTGTLQTSMKKYDLMFKVNGRGTYLCSQKCLPYLKASSNPHILNISPPLNMSPKWFKGHVAYTMAKYGMSMCALGMAEEFRDDGIAVNTLWPRTAIMTAAMENMAGSEIEEQCRKVEIMSDSAYLILSKDSRSFTANFCIDDEVLRAAGITDLSEYACVPGKSLLPDFFLDDVDPDDFINQIKAPGTKSSIYEAQKKKPPSGSGQASQTFASIKSSITPDLLKSIGGVFQFKLTGAESGTWFIDLKEGQGSVGEGSPPGGAQCTMTMDSDDFVQMFKGSLKPTAAFMSGKLKIEGDMGLAMKLEKLMPKAKL